MPEKYHIETKPVPVTILLRELLCVFVFERFLSSVIFFTINPESRYHIEIFLFIVLIKANKKNKKKDFLDFIV